MTAVTADLIGTLRAIVRDELARLQPPELGVVTQVHPRDADGSVNNHQVNVRLRATGVELQRVPVAVGRLGLSALPNEGDLLLINFVNHDLNAPVAVGCVYDDQAHPPVAQPHELVYEPPDDADSAVRRLHVALRSGSEITLDDDRLQILFGGTSLVIHRDGDVVIQAAGKVTVEADGDLELTAGGGVTIEAGANLTLKAGANATLEGSAKTTVKGAQVALAGITQFSAS